MVQFVARFGGDVGRRRSLNIAQDFVCGFACVRSCRRNHVFIRRIWLPYDFPFNLGGLSLIDGRSEAVIWNAI